MVKLTEVLLNKRGLFQDTAATMWKQLRVAAVNVVLVIVVGVLWLVLRKSTPTELGFFCEDM